MISSAKVTSMETVQKTKGSEDAQKWTALLHKVAKDRDRSAFRDIYQHFAPRIKAYAINQGIGQHADELVQEVMTSVWRSADKYVESLAAPSTWIFTITRNQRIDILRKLGRLKAEINVETEELWQIPTETDTTVQSIQALAAEKHLRQSIKQLPEEQLIAVRKVYYEGKTHQEVAQELNVPLGTLKGRLRLSMKKLKVMLEAKEL
ncbi:sigma-70 family RNA polymerase sigma factor [Gilvimarinus sp. 1_MG-2023]|uniref:sigma-70 family RNA polymerase sigma factor n=1 Tax=Gilvimarinus sp. 1_MG-2023 TaxID=3062638 RepID=UPI0026E4044D|nr:sigma-70 family RNA polymerase sigma factor [Gilvimarinus sp. 1_MG-2023]MDO6748244.1 sigma-70 family RNA polymerase sigma factor [Gilvimarinus sp. 1_MG-2023]